ncbi:pilus assembly protein [Shigella sonnei]|nr:pilus assembly protein [Shigella sonnei]
MDFSFHRVLIILVTSYTFVLIAYSEPGNDSNLLIVFYVQIMPDDFVMQLHRF